MTIPLPILNHTFDEEQGFPTPPRVEPRRVSIHEYVAMALMAFGLVFFVLNCIALSSDDNAPTWNGFLLSFGLMIPGGLAFWWARYRGTARGIKHDNTWFSSTQARGLIGWGLGLFLTAFYVVLYWYNDLQNSALNMPALFKGPIRTLDPLALALTKSPADQWFLYGFLYTVLVLVMGVRMYWRYRHSTYHLIRTTSVMFFQLGLAFMLPGILKATENPEYYFTYFWPLKPEYSFPGQTERLWTIGTVGQFMVIFSAVAILILTPVLTYFFGKRWYCSWVCGCGGLAETLGDPWRQLSSKSKAAWRVERVLIHSVLVVIVALTGLLWLNNAMGNEILGDFTGAVTRGYFFVIVNIFSGVVGVGFYPLMGSRVWCRFGCPMAAILGLLQRYFSRFRITTNGDQCMSCGNCSTYCEMGIDVRAYAQRGENIVRASCVGCGICAAVCPRGVLKLENGGPEPDRYTSVGGPLSQAIADIRNGADPHRNPSR